MKPTPTVAELQALGYSVEPPYREGDILPAEFILKCPDGKITHSRLDSNLWAIALQHYRKSLIAR